MGGFIRSSAKRVEVTGVNQQIDKNVLKHFKDKCKEQGYPMNVIVETFMQQYTSGRFPIDESEILYWKKNVNDVEVFNGMYNKEIYVNFKQSCKCKGYFIRYVLTAFMKEYADKKYIMEFKRIAD